MGRLIEHYHRTVPFDAYVATFLIIPIFNYELQFFLF